MSNIAKQLCLSLAYAESEDEVVDLLQSEGYWEAEDHWQFYGGLENNFSIINNQTISPDRALVEKLTNGIDQITILECLKRGIDPEGPDAPKNIKEALELFFGIKNGDLMNLGRDKWTDLARKIKLISTGTTKNPNFIVYDEGTGQSANTMAKTMLSLAASNKFRIPFTMGKYNQGGSAVLPFCKLQLIISKQNRYARNPKDVTADQFCWSIVRKESPKGNETSSQYTYFAPAGKILSFPARSLPLLPGPNKKTYDQNMESGTLIKMYDYDIGTSLRSLIITRLNSRISTLLPNTPLPVRIYERRETYKNKDNKAKANMLGLSTRIRQNMLDNLEPEFPKGDLLMVDGEPITMSIYAFKSNTKLDSYKKKESIIFTYKGQNMGSFSESVFQRKGLKKIKNIAKSLIIFVDCTNISTLASEQIFMPSRDRLREASKFGQLLVSQVVNTITNDESLVKLAQLRFKEQMSKRVKDSTDLENSLKEILNNDPTLSKLLGKGKSRIHSSFYFSDKVSTIEWSGKVFPLQFELVKEFPQTKPKRINLNNKKFRIAFKTDANNDYFTRDDSPGTMEVLINGTPSKDFHIKLNNGKAILGLKTPSNFIPDMLVRIECVVNDISRSEPFRNELYVLPKILETNTTPSDHQKKTPDSVAVPPFLLVKKEDWDEDNNFNESSALYVTEHNDKRIYHINVDNHWLVNQIQRDQEHKNELIEKWTICLILFGLVKRAAYERSKSDKYDVNERIFNDSRDYAPFIVPVITRMYNEDILRTALAA